MERESQNRDLDVIDLGPVTEETKGQMGGDQEDNGSKRFTAGILAG